MSAPLLHTHKNIKLSSPYVSNKATELVDGACTCSRSSRQYLRQSTWGRSRWSPEKQLCISLQTQIVHRAEIDMVRYGLYTESTAMCIMAAVASVRLLSTSLTFNNILIAPCVKGYA